MPNQGTRQKDVYLQGLASKMSAHPPTIRLLSASEQFGREFGQRLRMCEFSATVQVSASTGVHNRREY
jgi:hypothetical protein